MVFFLETGRFSKKNREAIKAQTGQSPRGIRGLDRFLQKQITGEEQGSDHRFAVGLLSTSTSWVGRRRQIRAEPVLWFG